MLAAVLLGGPPAAIVGALTIGIGWFRSRERGDLFRNNLATFTWFPLLSGLLFHWLAGPVGVNLKHVDASTSTTRSYYLIVFATFMVALALNFAMVTGYEASDRAAARCRRSSAEFKPVHRSRAGVRGPDAGRRLHDQQHGRGRASSCSRSCWWCSSTWCGELLMSQQPRRGAGRDGHDRRAHGTRQPQAVRRLRRRRDRGRPRALPRRSQ